MEVIYELMGLLQPQGEENEELMKEKQMFIKKILECKVNEEIAM